MKKAQNTIIPNFPNGILLGNPEAITINPIIKLNPEPKPQPNG